jgi:localization factor PodJL
VGEQLGRVTERLNQRYDRAQSELTDRIHQSEERTVKLLDEAREKIDARLLETQRRASLEAAADAARQAVAAESEPPAESTDHVAELAAPFGVAGAPGQTFSSDPFASPAQSFSSAPEPFAISPDVTDFSGPAAPFTPAQAPPAEAPSAFAFDPEPARPTSTRQMLDQARAAMRAASERPEGKGRGRMVDAVPAGSVEAPPFEGDSKGFGFVAPKKKKKDGVTIRTALLASGTAAALAVTGAGAVLLVNSEMGVSAERQGEHFGVAPTAVADETPPPPVSAAGGSDASGAAAAPAAPAQMAVALTPPPGQLEGLKPTPAQAKPAAQAVAPPQKANAASAKLLYSSAVRRIESGDLSGVDDLKKAANLGDGPAQFYLAKLYETGGAGLKKDLTEARRWTERAAQTGDVAAMHNLGLYYYEGEAGPQDSAKAAQWFLKAAEQGVKDSQYNLALLYAKGYGVAQNPAEAYKWYLIAAAAGDDGAKSAAQSIRAELSPETQAAAERAAAAFHAQTQASIRTASSAQTPQSKTP